MNFIRENIDNVPLALLKKHNGQQLFTGFFSNLEMAALSLASLKDSAVPLTIEPVVDTIETSSTPNLGILE
jgi:hypothetical protein